MKDILVIGSGIVGICTGIELIERGHSVTLIDPNDPGSQTSYGNAGVITDSSLIIINNPQLLKSLFSFIFKKKTAFRYSKLFVISRFFWIIRFLLFSNQKHMEKAAKAYKDLQTLSLSSHKELIKKTHSTSNVLKPGWLKLFKTEESFKKYSSEIEILNKNNVEYTVLNTYEIAELVPDLNVKFWKGILFKNSIRVNSPLDLSKKYFEYFIKKKGTFINDKCHNLKYISSQWNVLTEKNKEYKFDEVIVSTGPWSKSFLSNLGYNIPLAWERGYHHHFSTKNKISIIPVIHDVEGGFVYSSIGNEIRITSGVELNFFDASPNENQIDEAAKKLSKILPLDKKLTPKAWLGSRPTIVDSMPMIGIASKHKQLWFNFGHNHIGLSTSAGSAKIIADLIEKKKMTINILPFCPSRFDFKIFK
jgi:D-amino-acid dehydrogenase